MELIFEIIAWWQQQDPVTRWVIKQTLRDALQPLVATIHDRWRTRRERRRLELGRCTCEICAPDGQGQA